MKPLYVQLLLTVFERGRPLVSSVLEDIVMNKEFPIPGDIIRALPASVKLIAEVIRRIESLALTHLTSILDEYGGLSKGDTWK